MFLWSAGYYYLKYLFKNNYFINSYQMTFHIIIFKKESLLISNNIILYKDHAK